jgi:hypothetical protein
VAVERLERVLFLQPHFDLAVITLEKFGNRLPSAVDRDGYAIEYG